MPRFRFGLDRLLAVRRMEEDVARAAVAEATAAVVRGADRLQDAGERVRLAQKRLRETPGQPVEARELRQSALYMRRMGKERIAAEASLAEAREARSEKASAARAAWQSREVLDKLRAHRLETFRRDEEKAAQAAVDDLTASRWERRSRL